MASHVKRSWVGSLVMAAGAAVAVGLGAPAASADPVAQLVQTGFNLPTYATGATGDYSRLFVLEKAGLIKVLDMTTPSYAVIGTFLDLTAIVNTPAGNAAQQQGEERGLLGLAFHPQFQANGKFYVYYSSKAVAGLPGANGYYNVVAEYVVRAPGSGTPNPALNAADPASGRTLLRMPKAQGNHNGGWMDFGPDEFLYIATGDGGSGDDFGSEHTPDIGNAQDTTKLLGKILRIDVSANGPAPDGPLWTNATPSTADDSVVAYGVPSDNPTLPVPAGLTGPARREIWAYGLRNPWRASFDRLTGDLWIGDVGQGRWEEIDFQPALTASNLAQVAGRNYGWRCFEGTVQFVPSFAGPVRSASCPPNYNSPGMTGPVGVYSHGQGGAQPALAFPTSIAGIAITGGYVYRGCRVPELYGRYLFTDYATSGPSRVWSTTLLGGVATTPIRHDVYVGSTAVTPNVPATAGSVSVVSFGQDSYGEVYIVNQASGRLFKLVTTNGGVPLANADYNRNGQVDLLDIFDFLNRWFALDPKADYNRVGGVELLDIFAFLTAWFGGCPG